MVTYMVQYTLVSPSDPTPSSPFLPVPYVGPICGTLADFSLSDFLTPHFKHTQLHKHTHAHQAGEHTHNLSALLSQHSTPCL